LSSRRLIAIAAVPVLVAAGGLTYKLTHRSATIAVACAATGSEGGNFVCPGEFDLGPGNYRVAATMVACMTAPVLYSSGFHTSVGMHETRVTGGGSSPQSASLWGDFTVGAEVHLRLAVFGGLNSAADNSHCSIMGEITRR
jgi:hypothetical protein